MVVGIASQPFWLFWDDEASGRRRSHAPDYFARMADGAGPGGGLQAGRADQTA